MYTILRKTRLPTLYSSTHNRKYVFESRVRNPTVKWSAKRDELMFLQNCFSGVSFRHTIPFLAPVFPLIQKRNYPHEIGSGAGKGGGGGGTVREAGGSLGKYGAANEDQFFHNKSKDELERIRKEKQKQDKGKASDKEEK